jgi:group II intron reverse transcriptase/maturase
VNAEKLTTPKDKVRKLQRKLYQSAKRNKARKFHALYDKLYREDILYEAWKRVKVNGGSAGIDEQTIEEIENHGVERIIEEIQEDLKGNSYNPPPVRRVYIPKADGNKRPLGIPTVKDRIVQSAMKLVIEPIFEADFKDCSYGFRPKRNQHQALEVIRKACNNRGNYVLDGDIKGYFNNINHEKLMMLVERRINDRRINKMIRKWLRAGIMENGNYEESTIGSPQGVVVSPLLANLYLDYLDTIWERHYGHLGKLVRYADDFVIVCKSYKDVSNSFRAVKLIMSRLELELNMEKTRIVNLWSGKDGFVFLGMEIRKVKMRKVNGTEYYAIDMWVCKMKQIVTKEVVKETLKDATLYQDLEEMIKRLNRKIVGWRGYYHISNKRILFKLDRYILMRLVYWYNRKKQKSRRYHYGEHMDLFRNLGLKRIAFAS